MKYRSRIEITGLILESAKAGATKTRIMYKAYLSYFQVGEYLKYLQQNDLIVLEHGTQLYRPTKKGLRFLNLSNDLSEMSMITHPKFNKNNQ